MFGKFVSYAGILMLSFCFLQVHFIFISLISAYDEDDLSDQATVSGMFNKKSEENTCTGPECVEKITLPECSETQYLDEKLGICLDKSNLEVCEGDDCKSQETELKIEPEIESKPEVVDKKEEPPQITKPLPKTDREEDLEEEEEGLTPEEIQRLAAAFVFCIIGTLASRGNLIWTAILYAYLVAMFYRSMKMRSKTLNFISTFHFSTSVIGGLAISTSKSSTHS